MTADGRVGAWIQAWQILRQVEKLRTDHKKRPIESPPDLYWGWLTEAKIFTQLATADLAVGISAGAWLEDQARDEAESLVRNEDFMEFMERRAADKNPQEET